MKTKYIDKTLVINTLLKTWQTDQGSDYLIIQASKTFRKLKILLKYYLKRWLSSGDNYLPDEKKEILCFLILGKSRVKEKVPFCSSGRK